ncbi:MAG: hypothetical protein M3O68_06915 [Thermoproteota archaeon]|nr:hypothetical protein [Thermoproteota archaeon]
MKAIVLDMLPEGVRGTKSRKEGQFKLMKQVRSLLPLKKDREIMKILRIPNATFYRYKSKIYKEDKEFWSKVMLESIESRAYRLYETLEESFRISRAIALDETARPMDRMRASKKMVNAQYNILNLLTKGPNTAEYHEFI